MQMFHEYYMHVLTPVNVNTITVKLEYKLYIPLYFKWL